MSHLALERKVWSFIYCDRTQSNLSTIKIYFYKVVISHVKKYLVHCRRFIKKMFVVKKYWIYFL